MTVDQHRASLTRVLRGHGDLTVPGALEVVLGQFGVASGDWSIETRWALLADRLSYASVITAWLESGGRRSALELIIPAFCDDGARVRGAPPVGAHDGLYAGEPLVPVAQLITCPGLHLLVRPSRARLRTDDDSGDHLLVLKPDLGRGVRIRPGRAVSERWGLTVESLRAGRALTAAGYVGASTRAGLLADLAESADPATLLARPVIDRVAAQPYAPGHAGLRYYGDLVLQRLVLIAGWELGHDLAALRSADQHDRLGPALSNRLRRAVADLIARSAVIQRDDRTDTLAQLERRRMITTFGPYGLSIPTRGNLDYRDLHPGWHGEICPLQTPESDRIGLISYATTGGSGPWADVSFSAALIPYLNHTDQARAILAAKNLKQAVPLDHTEVPLVRTGLEEVIGSAVAVRSRQAGEVVEIGEAITVRGPMTNLAHAYGPADPLQVPGPDWTVPVVVGDHVVADQVLAHPPDVVIVDGVAQLALGVDLLTAVTPWYGLNFEDAVVLSASAAAKLTHTERVHRREQLADGSWLWPLADVGSFVERGETLGVINDHDGASNVITAEAGGVLDQLHHDADRGEVRWVLRVRRPLEVGDKVTNRHGGKGVVSAILRDDEMPTVPALGRTVEMITSPLGVVRRLMIGQLMELGAGLRALLTDGRAVIAGRRLVDRAQVAADLATLGAADGRLPLAAADGRGLFEGNPVLVGPQHILKLVHTTAGKLSVRGEAGQAAWRQQPSSQVVHRDGRRVGAAQRLGEMELWAMAAVGAGDLLTAVLDGRPGGDRPTWEATVAHLAAAGFEVTRDDDRLRLSLADHRACHTLRPFTATELHLLKAYRADPRSAWAHPLHDDGHGQGHAERRQLRRSFDLSALPVQGRPQPLVITHPWTGQSLTDLAVLPAAFRSPHDDDFDALYLAIADCVAPAAPGRSGWEGRPPQVERLQNLIGALFGARPGRLSAQRSTGLHARLAGKRGLLRGYLLGTSRDHSGRAVIVPDPTLPIEEVGLPAALYDVLIGADPDTRILINRAPSLTPGNLVVVRARRVDTSALALHPQLLLGLAGDFDGDTVAVHRLPAGLARQQAWERLRPGVVLSRRGDGSPAVKADLDLALGLHLADPAADPRSWWATVLAESADDPIDRVGNEQRRQWEAATGWSLGFLGSSRHDTVDSAIAAEPELAQLLHAGGVKRQAVEQLLVIKGSGSSHNPDLPVAVDDGCLLDGLQDEAYFHGARAGRARLADKKLLTPVAGALTKSLVEIGYEVVVSGADCGSAAERRSPLTCATLDPCQACFGALPDSGRWPPEGMRVGVMAGMLIGERSTQLAMKTFHVGATAVLDVPELKALLGQGRSAVLAQRLGVDREAVSLAAFLRRRPDRAEALQEVGEAIRSAISDAVAPAYIEVILRQLSEAFDDAEGPRGSLAQRAERRRRDPLVQATSRGSVRWMTTGPTPSSVRQSTRVELITGRPT